MNIRFCLLSNYSFFSQKGEIQKLGEVDGIPLKYIEVLRSFVFLAETKCLLFFAF